MEGIVDSPDCCSCGAAPGTIRHLAWACDATAARARQLEDFVRVEAAASSSEHLVWSRALFPHPARQLPQPVRQEELRWVGPEAAAGRFEPGLIFVDGSVRHSWSWRAARGGFACVQLSRDVEV